MLREDTYRRERARDLSFRQHERRMEDLGATGEAENAIRLLDVILAQLARQENSLLDASESEDNSQKREAMKQEVTELIQTIL